MYFHIFNDNLQVVFRGGYHGRTFGTMAMTVILIRLISSVRFVVTDACHSLPYYFFDLKTLELADIVKNIQVSHGCKPASGKLSLCDT